MAKTQHELYQHRLIRKNRLTAYGFLLPNFIGFFIFTFIPVIVSLYLSFHKWNGATPATFVGFKNFTKLLTSTDFKVSFRNTCLYTLGVVPATMVFAIALALLLNKGIKGITAFRAIHLFPYISSVIAISVVWKFLYNTNVGPINQALRSLGVADPPRWLSSSTWALPSVMIMIVWKNMGYYMIVYLAGLQSIPKTLYEAAELDGANAWRRIFNVTLPMLSPTTFYATIMCIIGSFQVFTSIYTMTQGGPGRATSVLVYLIYDEAFVNFNLGYASAISLVLFLCIFIVTLIQFRGQKKWVNY